MRTMPTAKGDVFAAGRGLLPARLPPPSMTSLPSLIRSKHTGRPSEGRMGHEPCTRIEPWRARAGPRAPAALVSRDEDYGREAIAADTMELSGLLEAKEEAGAFQIDRLSKAYLIALLDPRVDRLGEDRELSPHK